MRMQRLISVGMAAVLGVASGAAFAGELAGPPGTGDGKQTGAPENANSACAYSGLNDMDPATGQNASIVQTVADAWKYYGLRTDSPAPAAPATAAPTITGPTRPIPEHGPASRRGEMFAGHTRVVCGCGPRLPLPRHPMRATAVIVAP